MKLSMTGLLLTQTLIDAQYGNYLWRDHAVAVSKKYYSMWEYLVEVGFGCWFGVGEVFRVLLML